MVYFVSGIDTDTGKSVVTGLLARVLSQRGNRVITQKFIQTGCSGISEDILKHRQLMGIDPLPEDRDGTTCPYVLSYPASPHLAAEIDGVVIDPGRITEATRKLEASWETILLEGAGGLYVPVCRDYYTIDYIREQGYPLILVTSSKLGSINHTILSLEACWKHGIPLACLVYNRYPNDSEQITADSVTIFKSWLDRYAPDCRLLEMPVLHTGEEERIIPAVEKLWEVVLRDMI